MTYTYDNLGRVKTATYSDGLVLTYTYTGEGSLYSVTTEENNEVTTYNDSLDRLIASERQDGETTVIRARQEYDATSRVVWQTWQLADSIYSLAGTEDFAYGSDYTTITYELMVQAVEEVYKDMPAVLDDVLEWLVKNWSG